MGFLKDKLKSLLFEAQEQSLFRTLLIVQSSAHIGMNLGQKQTIEQVQAQYNQEYKFYKIWITEKDDKVRKDHKKMEGKRVLIDEKFLVGSDLMDGPGDDSASMKQWINCRCFLRHKREEK